MYDVYKNISNCNPNRKKILIVFNDMIADIITNKKIQVVIKELFIRCRKLNISLVWKKSVRFIVKVTLTDELKIIDDKMKANQAHYNLDREAAKISALSSNELKKYEYLTFENLGYKSGVAEKAKF